MKDVEKDSIRFPSMYFRKNEVIRVLVYILSDMAHGILGWSYYSIVDEDSATRQKALDGPNKVDLKNMKENASDFYPI